MKLTFQFSNVSCSGQLLVIKVYQGTELKDELPRSVGAQYATGDQWRNNSRNHKEMEAKQKQHPVVDVIGDGSKV